MKDGIDVIIRSSHDGTVTEADNEAIVMFRDRVKDYRAEDHEGDRLRVHLILRNQSLADQLKRVSLEEEMAANVELYAYTMEDLWAMQMLGVSPESNSRLDRMPIVADSGQHVHLLIFGSSAQSESLAVHTVLTAHFPNYCRDNSLRTRITMVADSHSQFRHFQQRYRNLLLNSYRRMVTVVGDEVRCEMLAPQYAGRRKDFVDVEWEFVEASLDHEPLVYKLQQWSRDEKQQLTVVFCYENEERNVADALALQENIDPSVPIWLKVNNSVSIDFLRNSAPSSLVPFGMDNAVLPNMGDFIRLAQCVNYAYCQMRSTNKDEQEQGMTDMSVALEIPSERTLQELWNNKRLNTPKRWSNIYNSFTLRGRMQALGHPYEDWGTLFAIADKDVAVLAEVEHNRWSAEELIMGFRPATENELEEAEKDLSWREKLKQKRIHVDLKNYYELGNDDTGLSVVRYDVGLIRTLPLVAYTYKKLKGDKHE